MNNTAAYNTDNTIHKCGLSAQAIAWVMEHGSEYLRSCAEKGIWCRSLYHRERAQLEAPGWSLLDESTYPSPNPPEGAMDLLLRARERFPQAHLRQVDGEGCVEFVAVADVPWSDWCRLVFNDKIVVEKD